MATQPESRKGPVDRTPPTGRLTVSTCRLRQRHHGPQHL